MLLHQSLGIENFVLAIELAKTRKFRRKKGYDLELGGVKWCQGCIFCEHQLWTLPLKLTTRS